MSTNLEERQEEHQGGVGAQCTISNSSGAGGDNRQEMNSSPSMGRDSCTFTQPTYSMEKILCATCCWVSTLFLPENTGKQKPGKTSSRKSKSPNLGQAYSAGERPSSVSSVHSEGDYHRQAQAQAQWSWDDRPSSTGELSSDLSEPPDCTCLVPLLPRNQPTENITDDQECFSTLITKNVFIAAQF